MITLTFIEGACVDDIELDEFTELSCFHFLSGYENLTLETLNTIRQEWWIEDSQYYDDKTDVKVHTNGPITVVSCFNQEGEAYFFIGSTNDFVSVDKK